ncbi:MAG: hypothetical protein FWF06_02870 [Symbiobacteriaceae bacterium]|nr:hypothetical protein [Symbiobacteriaceae bacterium]
MSKVLGMEHIARLTARQKELLVELEGYMNDREEALFLPLISHLLSLGYSSRRHKKSNFVVEFVQYGRIIAKMELKPRQGLVLYLRYADSSTVPEVFRKALATRPAAWVKRGQEWKSPEEWQCCGYCKDNISLYRFTGDDGKARVRCGLAAVAIPGLTPADLPATLLLIDDQHKFYAARWGLQGS